jgi:molybdopterin synthase sulfur carrier subunit
MADETGRSVRLLYFAWLREKVGHAEEQIELPSQVATVADLVDWLRQRGPEYVDAFSRPQVVRAAIDKVHVKSTASLGAAREIAFFPPVTGG